MPDERPGPDAHLFRELHDKLRDLSEHVEKLSDRMAEISTLAEIAKRNAIEIRRLRDRAEENAKSITRLEKHWLVVVVGALLSLCGALMTLLVRGRT